MDPVLVVENPLPVTATWDKVTLGPPAAVELVRVRCMVFELPTAMLPKLKLVELSDNAAVACPPGVLELAFVERLQPERKSAAARVRTVVAAICQ